MKRNVTITVSGKGKPKTQSTQIKTREPFAPKQQVVESKKTYSRKNYKMEDEDENVEMYQWDKSRLALMTVYAETNTSAYNVWNIKPNRPSEAQKKVLKNFYNDEEIRRLAGYPTSELHRIVGEIIERKHVREVTALNALQVYKDMLKYHKTDLATMPLFAKWMTEKPYQFARIAAEQVGKPVRKINRK